MISRRPLEYDLSQVDPMPKVFAKRAAFSHKHTVEEMSEVDVELASAIARMREWKLALKRDGKLRVKF